MDQDLIPYFERLSQQIAGLREEVNQRFEQVDQRFEAAETTARQTHVLVEGLRHDLQLVAEGMIGYNTVLDGYQHRVDAELLEVRRVIEPSYKGLDGRVSVLEEWVKCQQENALDTTRKKVLTKRSRQQDTAPSSDSR